MSISARLRFKVLARDSFTCQYCGATGKGTRLEVDHITPQSRGGSDEPDNLATACDRCNRGKSNLTEPEMTISEMAEDAFWRSIESTRVWNILDKPARFHLADICLQLDIELDDMIEAMLE